MNNLSFNEDVAVTFKYYTKYLIEEPFTVSNIIRIILFCVLHNNNNNNISSFLLSF